jgi:hypothetical protein
MMRSGVTPSLAIPMTGLPDLRFTPFRPFPAISISRVHPSGDMVIGYRDCRRQEKRLSRFRESFGKQSGCQGPSPMGRPPGETQVQGRTVTGKSAKAGAGRPVRAVISNGGGV